MYNDQSFDTVDDLVKSYDDGTIEKIKIPRPSPDTILKGSSRPRGEPFFDKPKRGPLPFEPNGRRYKINGNRVQYGSWKLDLGVRGSAGIAVYNVMFKKERIAYEVSLQEGASFYSGYNPKVSNQQFLDSVFGLGTSMYGLNAGTDCPENSVFLDVLHMYDSGEPVHLKDAVCVFEWNAGIPIRRHYEFEFKKGSSEPEGMFYYSGSPDNALVVRTIITPYNYDYIADYIFHQNGVVEIKVSTNGYLNTAFYTKEEDSYGFPVYNNIYGPLHDHFILFKVDLDVAGRENSFVTYEVRPESEAYPWGREGEIREKKKITKVKRKAEQDAIIKYNFDVPKFYVLENEHAQSRPKLNRGYRIEPKYMVKQLYPDSDPVTRKAEWTKYQVSVTKHNEQERFGSSVYNQYGGEEPVFSFDEYLKNNDNIENEDLVAWVSIGGLHIPVAEDIPTTFSTGNSYTFYLRPFNFFDSDPSMASRDGVFIINKDGKVKTDTFGMPEHSSCPVPKRKFW